MSVVDIVESKEGRILNMTCRHGADHKETFCRDAFCGHSNKDELYHLKAENARLREALDDIVHCIYSDEATLQWVETKAREALKGGE